MSSHGRVYKNVQAKRKLYRSFSVPPGLFRECSPTTTRMILKSNMTLNCRSGSWTSLNMDFFPYLAQVVFIKYICTWHSVMIQKSTLNQASLTGHPALIFRNSPDVHHSGRVGQVCHHGDLYGLSSALCCQRWTGGSFQFAVLALGHQFFRGGWMLL